MDAEGTLNKLDLASKKSQIISKIITSGLRTAGFARGGAWGTDGTIIFTPNSNAPIQRVFAAGSEAVNVTKLDPSILDGSHRFPVFLSDGQHFIFTVWSNHAETATRVGGIYLASLKAGVIRKLTSDLSQAILSGNDQLLVYRNGSLVGLSFDQQKLQMKEGETEIISGPLYSLGSGAIYATTSNAGDLAFALSTSGSTGQLSWLDRTGKVIAAIGHQRLAMRRIIVSPGGNKFVGQVDGSSGQEIWIGDTEREIFTRLTRGGLDATNPVWSPDESQITFTTQQEGTISVYIQPADGNSPPQLLTTDKDRDFLPTSWSSDGKYLFLDSNAKTSGKNEIWLYDFSEKKPRLILSDPSASLSSGTLSPDGHWLVYVSDESGNQEVFLRPFPSLDRKWQISNSGGTAPHWRNDNHEILFIAPDLSVQSVKMEVKENVLQASSPVLLFPPKLPMTTMDPSPDHKRFLAAVLPADVRAEPIHLILGWKSR